MSTRADYIAICKAGHIYGFHTLPPERCPDCGKAWQDPPQVHDPQYRDLLEKQKEAA